MASPRAARVAIVDSGIDPAHPLVRGRGAVLPGALVDSGGPVPGATGSRDELGHGTIVAAAVLCIAPGAELLPLRVFDRDPVCDFHRVLAALDRALADAAPVCNLSLGTTSLDFRSALSLRIDAARRAGVRIVTPASFAGLPCDPGSLPGVDAVVADPNVAPRFPVQREHEGRTLWFASPVPPRGIEARLRLRARGESIACGYVSGFLAVHGAP
jgi:subtilisin family serine protease